MAGMSEAALVLLDPSCVAEIRQLERKVGRSDVLAGFIRALECNVAGFPAAFRHCLASGDAGGAMRAAHTLKGSSLQLGMQALAELFGEIEAAAKAGDYAAALSKFHAASALIAQSLEALKRA
jgi:HPt (histidine-containing phosphotransfer) domain-containing protein